MIALECNYRLNFFHLYNVYLGLDDETIQIFLNTFRLRQVNE